MAVLTCNPSNRATVINSCVAGDVLLHEAGTYSSWSWKSGVTFRAIDWTPWRAIEGTYGHYGAGFGCRITKPDISISSSFTGVKWEGFWHDVRGDTNTGFTNNLVVSSPGFEARDFCVTGVKANGGRNIYCTVLDPVAGANILFERFRINGVGQPNQSLDHAFYFECPDGWSGTPFTSTPIVTLREFIITDGGAYPFHFFPCGTGVDISKFIIYKARRGTTFSGSSNYAANLNGTSHDNILKNGIWSDRTESGTSWAHIEYYKEGTVGLPYNNQVKDGAVYRGNGQPKTHDPTGLSNGSFTFTNMTLNNTLGELPGFADPDNGDFRLTTSSRAYVDAQAAGVQRGPTTIQPGYVEGSGTPPSGGGSSPTSVPFGTGTVWYFEPFNYDDGPLGGNVSWPFGFNTSASATSFNVASSKVGYSGAHSGVVNNRSRTVFKVNEVTSGDGLDYIFGNIEIPNSSSSMPITFKIDANLTGTSYIGVVLSKTSITLVKCESSVVTELGSFTHTWVAGNSLGIRGTKSGDFSVYIRNGSSWSAVSGLTSSQPSFIEGLISFSSDTPVAFSFDYFEMRLLAGNTAASLAGTINIVPSLTLESRSAPLVSFTGSVSLDGQLTLTRSTSGVTVSGKREWLVARGLRSVRRRAY